MTFGSILGNEGHLEKSNVKSLLLRELIIMITGSSFAIVKVAFLAVDEQLLLHLLYPVLQSYIVQYVKMCILTYRAAIPPQWHC